MSDEELNQDLIQGISNLGEKRKLTIIRELLKHANIPNTGTNTYFHQKFAEQLLPDIQILLKEDCELRYPYADYKWKPHSLYQYINNAFKYIVDNMDDENGTYKALRDRCRIRECEDCVMIIPEVGINGNGASVLRAIRQPRGTYSGKDKTEENLGENSRDLTYKRSLFIWLDEAELGGTAYEWKKPITDEERKSLKDYFEGTEEFGIVFNPDGGFIVRKIA